MNETIVRALDEGVQLRQQCRETLPPLLAQAATCMSEALQRGGKILACGNGGSATDAQHFTGELVNRFERDRPALAAVALTADVSVITSIGNDDAFNAIFSRQVEALGRPGDVLLAISTSGNSGNVVAAAEAAGRLGMTVVALTGRDGGTLGRIAKPELHLNIPHASTARVQEMHITCLHLICTLIDNALFGDKP
jgi:phosphoheptose isomerase